MQTVFHVSSSVPDDQEHAVANVENLLDDESVHDEADTVALVANGGGVRLFVAATATASDRVARLRSGDVDLYACGNALQGRGFTADDLLSGVEVVSSGTSALARLQNEGYGYVKVP